MEIVFRILIYIDCSKCMSMWVHDVNEIMRGGAIHTHKANLLIVLNCKWALEW